MNDARNAMLTSYMALARHSWEDEDFKARLADTPRKALAEHGWELPEGTVVEVGIGSPEGAEQLGIEHLVAGWEQEIGEGKLRLLIPDEAPPGLETAELSDEQLASAAGGQGGVCKMLCTCCADGTGTIPGAPPS